MQSPKLIGATTSDGLISGDASRKIFDAVKNNCAYNERMAQYGILRNEFDHLKRLYQKKLQEISINEKTPRYYPFYCILKDQHPEIRWEIVNRQSGKSAVNFYLPLIDHLQPSLLSLLLGRVMITSKSNLLWRYSSLNNLSVNAIDAIETFIENTQMIYPSTIQMDLFIQWILNAQQGQPSTIFILTCPDYSVEPTSDPLRPYKHDFNSLGEGIGQIAKRIIGILPALKTLLNDLSLTPEIISAIADYEAFSPENVARMNVTKDEFLHRVNLSKLAFEKECNAILPIKSYMCSDLCNGEKAWIQKHEEIKQAFNIDDFGFASVNKSTFLRIAHNRKALYNRWTRKTVKSEYYLPVAISQAAEYTVIGYNIANKYSNCLILGADSELFGPFYSFYKAIPALYFKRFYC